MSNLKNLSKKEKIELGYFILFSSIVILCMGFIGIGLVYIIIENPKELSIYGVILLAPMITWMIGTWMMDKGVNHITTSSDTGNTANIEKIKEAKILKEYGGEIRLLSMAFIMAILLTLLVYLLVVGIVVLV